MRKLTRKRDKSLGLVELIAIALGGMVGGGIFSILGIAVEQVGNATPVAILIGGGLAFLAAYSYVKLALLYKDEGATYSFFKKTFSNHHFASSGIGWLITFGYISTLALYAYTFSSYFCSQFPSLESSLSHKVVAGGIIALFATINLISVKGMGKIEDLLVYTKIAFLLFISGIMAGKGDLHQFWPIIDASTSWSSVITVAAITFVAFEGFQLVIHAYNEMSAPQKNIPRAIYSSIFIATFLYIILAVGALAVIPKATIIADKEYALAAGAHVFLGGFGQFIVIFGALLATSSALSGTLFGASRLVAVIADDGYFPKALAHRIKVHIPQNAIIMMSLFAYALILTGGLKLILEFGSITFIIVSFLMAWANYRMRAKTKTSLLMAIAAMLGLFIAGVLIIYFEFTQDSHELFTIFGMYTVLVAGSFLYAKRQEKEAA
jgi:amino acid transporter